MGKVYVTQLPARMEGEHWVPTIDISPAKAFGDLKVLIPYGINFPMADMAVVQLRQELQMFDPENDCIILAGDPLIMAVAAAIIGQNFDSFNLLKWDRQQRKYISYTVEL